MEMSPEAKEARKRYQREYHREWAKKNRDKVKACETRHWEKMAQKYKEADAAEKSKNKNPN